MNWSLEVSGFLSLRRFSTLKYWCHFLLIPFHPLIHYSLAYMIFPLWYFGWLIAKWAEIRSLKFWKNIVHFSFWCWYQRHVKMHFCVDSMSYITWLGSVDSYVRDLHSLICWKCIGASIVTCDLLVGWYDWKRNSKHLRKTGNLSAFVRYRLKLF